MKEFKMLDMFSGLGGASQAMEEDPNWEVMTIDFKEKFEADICADVIDLEPEDFEKNYNLIWASPPCDRFSVSQISKYWTRENGILIPKTKATVEKIGLVYHSLWLIGELNPRWWFLENPRGMLRKIIGEPVSTVTYCQYGSKFMKPTDLWGVHPPSFIYKKCNPNDECHISNPRGAGIFRDETKKGDYKKKAVRSKIPYGLSEAIKEAVESPESRTRLEEFC